MSPRRIAVVLGTRPEAIKLAPVILTLRARPHDFECTVVGTGQQRELCAQALADFGLRPDHDLSVMEPDQSLAGLTSLLLDRLDPLLADLRPDWLLVQGDTASAMAGALVANYRRLRVGHVEAGLRTHDRGAPFPEEINRRLIAALAEVHFAATPASRDNLLREGVPEASIHLVGNTGIDALVWMRRQVRRSASALPQVWSDAMAGRRTILVTAHRRESFGEAMEDICLAIRDLADRRPEATIVCLVHPNPNVQSPMSRILGGHPRISLIAPLAYRAMVELMDRAELILTDSGGIQEEAPGLGKPVLVLREVTERPEGIEAGNALLAGTRREAIVAAAERLLDDREAYRAMSRARLPYGDGRAARRIVQVLAGRQTSQVLETCEV